MQGVTTTPKDRETSAGKIARPKVASTGADTTLWVLIPACAVAQMEQAWWGAVESSGWEWVACTTPITPTRATQSRQTNLTHAPCLAENLIF